MPNRPHRARHTNADCYCKCNLNGNVEPYSNAGVPEAEADAYAQPYRDTP
jgi:hypothetical protein